MTRRGQPTLADIGERLGVTEAMMSYVRSGARTLKAERLTTIADLTGWSVEDQLRMRRGDPMQYGQLLIARMTELILSERARQQAAVADTEPKWGKT